MDNNKININEAIDLAVRIGGKIDFLWNVFIFLSFPVIAWVFSTGRDLCIGDKLAVIFLYLVFSLINLRSVLVSYIALSRIIKHIQMLIKDKEKYETEFHEWLRCVHINDRPYIAFFAYLSIIILICTSLFMN